MKLKLTKKNVLLTINLSFYLEMTGSAQLAPGEIGELTKYWQKWFPLLNVYTLGEPKGYLLIFLDKKVEQEISAIWQASPSQGYRVDLIAKTMLMAAVKEFVPELAMLKCAPVPKVNKNIRKQVAASGLEVKQNGLLSHSYAVFTYYPYRGQCELCLFKDTCKKVL